MRPGIDPIFCRWTRDRLAAMAGDERPDAERPLIAAHLERCAGCREHLRSLRGAMAALELAAVDSPVDPRSPSLWPALEARIAAAETEPRSQSQGQGQGQGQSRPSIRGAAGFAAAAAVLIALIAVPRLQAWRADSEARIAAAEVPLPALATRVDPLEFIDDAPSEAAIDAESLAQNTAPPTARPAEPNRRYDFDLERGVPMPRGAQTGAAY